MCKKGKETIIYVFYECKSRTKTWSTFEPIIKKTKHKHGKQPNAKHLRLKRYKYGKKN